MDYRYNVTVHFAFNWRVLLPHLSLRLQRLRGVVELAPELHYLRLHLLSRQLRGLTHRMLVTEFVTVFF